MERRYVPGLVLIIIGGVLLLARQQLLSGDLTVLIIGTVFLVAYAFTGHHSFLVPGSIMTGLGAGIAARDRVGPGGATVLVGLGMGFLLIYVAEWARGNRRPNAWPVIPGGVLVVIGLLQVARAEGALTALASWWPILLILLGIWLIARPRPAQ